ncbi:MAG: galactose-1-phosphate uridylyltransferase [Promethearchaeota archaeon]
MTSLSNVNERRWNPFLQKWIIVAPKRENRPLDTKPFKSLDERPSQEKNAGGGQVNEKKRFCPFCVGAPEVPEPYDIKVLGNRFPALSLENTMPFTRLENDSPYKVAPAIGLQNVVLYTSEHDARFSDLPVEHVFKLVKVWKEKYVEIGSIPEIKYVFEFENRGALIGVSLSHPHGQIYSFSWIPFYIKKELESFKEYHESHGSCLLCDIVKEELAKGVRVIKENKNFLSCVPFFASWPHEVHIYAKKHVKSFMEFDDEMMMDFSEILKDINVRYDRLYPGYEMAFVMAIHQEPTDGGNHDYYHFHVEFYPPIRQAGVLKFAAGVELGTGTWINSSLPENFAKRMREINVS